MIVGAVEHGKWNANDIEKRHRSQRRGREHSPVDCRSPALLGGVMLIPLTLLAAPTLTPSDWLEAPMDRAVGVTEPPPPPPVGRGRGSWLPVGMLLDCWGVPGIEWEWAAEGASESPAPAPACLALLIRMGVLLAAPLPTEATPDENGMTGSEAVGGGGAAALAGPLFTGVPGDCTDCMVDLDLSRP